MLITVRIKASLGQREEEQMKHLWIWASLLTLTGYAAEPQPISSYFDKEQFSDIELIIEEAKDEPLIVMIEEDWDFEAPMQFHSDTAERGQIFPWTDEESTSDEYADFIEKKGSQDYHQNSPKKSQATEEMAQFQPSYEQLPSKTHRFQLERKNPEPHLSTKKPDPRKNILPKQHNQPAATKVQPLLQQPKPQQSKPSTKSVPQVIPKEYSKPQAPVAKKSTPSLQKPKNNPGAARENRQQAPLAKPNIQKKAPQVQQQTPSQRQAPKKQMTRKYQRQKQMQPEASAEE